MGDFFVITADIKDSKKCFNIDFMDIINNKIDVINNLVRNELYIEFSSNRGDEIQGVVEVGKNISLVIRYLKYIFNDYSLRVGIGKGSIVLNKDALYSWQLSGEAFFLARDALEMIRKFESKNKSVNYNVLFMGKDNILDYKIINSLYILLDEHFKKVKSKTIRRIISLEESNNIISQAIRNIVHSKTENNISINSFSQMLKRCMYYQVIHTEKLIKQILDQCMY